MEKKASKQSLKETIRFVFSNITVEPLLACFVLPNVMASLAVQNLNLEKACRVNLAFDASTCNAIQIRNSSGYNQTDEAVVQKLVASVYVWKNVVQSIFPLILLPLLGSWSDKHNKRKLCILLPISGEIFSNVGFLFCTYYFYELSLEVNVLVEVLPIALTGGWNVIFLGVFTYVCSVSDVETRTFRVGVVHIFFSISLTVGNALSGIVYRLIGFYGVFSLALCIYASALIYGVFFIKEEQTNLKQKKVSVKDFCDLSYISNSFGVVFKNQKGDKKKKLCFIFVLAMLLIGPIHGEMNVLYMYTRYKFQWNEIDFSVYFTYTCVTHLLGCVFALWFFSKYLKLDDALLGLISSSSKIGGCLVYAFAPSTLIFYLGTIVELFNGTAFIALRSLVSKLVQPEELGKVNSLFGMSEALMPLIYGPLYSWLYKTTIEVLPGSFFVLGAFLTIPAVLIFIWLYKKTDTDVEKKENVLLPHNQNNV